MYANEYYSCPGSVRVEFVPNPKPTRQNRVGKKCTCWSNRVGWFKPSTGGERVSRSHISRKTARNSEKNTNPVKKRRFQ